jgi:hypothetical protein
MGDGLVSLDVTRTERNAAPVSDEANGAVAFEPCSEKAFEPPRPIERHPAITVKNICFMLGLRIFMSGGWT